MEFIRELELPTEPKKSFFLWGPRQVGKSFLLRKIYPNARKIDLLKSDEFARFVSDPSYLRNVVMESKNRLIIIDEVQKIPQLLDEVQYLIEEKHAKFILCGSSARRLKSSGANLLGGRARRYELHGLVSKELADKFNLTKLLNVGNLPSHYLSDDPERDLDSYIGDYLKEEIAAEALVRNLPRFMDFLRAAAIGDTETVDYTKIGSECGATSATVRNHYSILEDTLLGFFLPAYVRRQKRRIIHSPKFYFANVGVVNNLAKRRSIDQGSELFGKAFENWLINEVRAYNSYRSKRWDLSYSRLSSGGEVDLIINDGELAFEFKSTKKTASHHLKGLRELKEDLPKIKSLALVNLELHSSITDDGIRILPVTEFLERLWGDRW